MYKLKTANLKTITAAGGFWLGGGHQVLQTAPLVLCGPHGPQPPPCGSYINCPCTQCVITQPFAEIRENRFAGLSILKTISSQAVFETPALPYCGNLCVIINTPVL